MSILPINIMVTLFAVAINPQPSKTGIVDSLIVFRRPLASIMNPPNKAPIGTAITITLAMFFCY